MSKSILIIDTPENCGNCPCHFTDMITFTPKGKEKFISSLCGINNMELQTEEFTKTRPEWCPLIEIP